MMIQEKSNGWERLKWLVTVPVVMGAMLVFAQPEVKDKLEEIAPASNQQTTNEDIASLKKFFGEEDRKTEDRLRRPDGTVVIHHNSVHILHIKPNSEIVFAGKTLTADFKTAIANHLREAKAEDVKENRRNEPYAILMKYSADAKEDIVLQVMKDIKAAFDILRSECMAQGVKDIEMVWPYRVSIEGPYKYFPDGVEITVSSADGSKTEVWYENRWKKYKELSKKYGKDAKVSFKVDKEAPDWLFKRTDEHLKKLFNNVQGTKDK